MPIPLLFKDDFNRANSTSLGVNWEERQGDLEVNANVLRTVGAVQHVALWKGLSPADVRVEATDVSTTDDSIGVSMRVGAGATPDFYATTFPSGLPGTFQLWKRVGGVLTQLGGNVAVTRVVGAKIRVEAIGTAVRTFYNGALAHSVTDGAVTAGAPGVWGNGATLMRLDNFEARGDFEWTFVPNAFSLRWRFFTEVVDYESGFQQRNQVWSRPQAFVTMAYEALSDGEKKSMQEFFARRRGRTEAFLVRDFVNPSPATEVFGIGDGTQTKFKVLADFASAVTTYTNGIVDSVQPTVDLFTGVVNYAAAPAKGAVLSADATNAR